MIPFPIPRRRPALLALRTLLLATLLGALASSLAQGSAPGARDVTVNRVRLPDATVAALEAAYATPVLDGRYWYDPISGLWGFEGGPAGGQLAPGLPLGGPLPADASGGTTAVFVNGRALHPAELAALERAFGPVLPGRYWMDARGIGGVEGGPPSFDLGAAARAAGGGPGYLDPGPFGTTGGDGSCFYYNDPETGSSVMGGGC